jgi:hypothetical protein
MRLITLVTFLLMTAGWISCRQDSQLFRMVKPGSSGIDFTNTIIENDSINVIDLENVYNGGAVAAGDFNNDGLQDLYFTGNLVPNKLYLNKGGLRFEDVTATAGVDGMGRWSRGVATVDINHDGLLDIYVCATLKRRAPDRANLLYINQGPDAKGIPVFKDMAAAYGVADTGQSTMAAFFDYDNDGDLDLYIATNEIVDGDFPNAFRPINKDGSHPNTDRLYRNEGSDSLGHPYFRNVSREAGILEEGYAHGLAIADLNRDGWKDVYVSNDYLSGNLMWVNNANGTFTNRVHEYFKHGAANAMGNDIADINNDGLSDIVELDMNPEDNYRKKMMLNPNSYQTYQNIDYFAYAYQYVRNCLQVNQGWGVARGDSFPHPVFAELAFFAGVAETDWSWTPSVADFDNDGFRDIIVSNGFPKDVTDHDFIAYRDEAFMVADKKQLLDQIPEVKLQNYAFRNNGDLRFTNTTKSWGLTVPSFTNGAIYVDLDNDGDLDYVSNNINDPAFLFENTLNSTKEIRQHYLRVSLQGEGANRNGLGAWVEIYDSSRMQVTEYSPYRGYLSSVDPIIHFGLGAATRLDSLVVKWPGGRKQTVRDVKADQLLVLEQKNASENYSWNKPQPARSPYFSDVTTTAGIRYIHEEKDFVDFNIQKLLPHKMSQYGPAIAAGDINGDGLDDMVIGGARNHSPVLLIQGRDGRFTEQRIISPTAEISKASDDMGLLLFDADGDADLDLYCASGTYENLPQTPDHRDNFFVNDGRGRFTLDTSAIPRNYTSKSCVRAADVDKDGDLDLFIAGRVHPGSYPRPVSSAIYRNDSKDGRARFTDVTADWAPGLKDIGLVCDALWSDIDNDGLVDLVLAGEWMPVTFLRNKGGKFDNITAQTGIAGSKGWWNSIAGADLDNDGDIDYILGNLGMNSFYRASDSFPVRIYAKDFDNNGNYDAIPSLYLPDVANGQKKEFPAQTRDDLVKQMIGFRQKFPSYKPFAVATMDQVLTPEERKNMLVLEANEFRSVVLMNQGNGKFILKPLPTQAQWSPINGIVVADLDEDEYPDLVVSTNDYGTEVTVGRYDALNGLVLKGDGKGGFLVLGQDQAGFRVPADGKALSMLQSADGRMVVAASQNKGPLKLFKHNFPVKTIPLEADDAWAILQLRSGSKRRVELYYGQGFLGQSSRRLFLGTSASGAEISKTSSAKRTVE